MAGQKLELTWVGKNKPVKLEPRLLLEVPEKSYCAKTKRDGDIFDNMLIHGDNLLALKALESKFAGKVRCIFIDPPYNTGSAFTVYDDNQEHSIWLNLMKARLQILRNLLTPDGSIYCCIDFNETHYLKILMDEVFGRDCFQREIIWRMGWLSGYKTMAKNYIRNHDTVLFYTKSPNEYYFNKEAAYNTPCEYQEKYKPAEKVEIKKKLEELFGVNKQKTDEMIEFLSTLGYPERYPLEDTWNCSVYDKLNSINVVSFSGEKVSKMLGVSEVKGQKSEALVQRILRVSTEPGDIVLDSFLGSGTTAAVAHKMGRRWIGVELADHCYTHCIPRMQKVIDGTDQSGISKNQNWQGGGGFCFYELAPSLIKKDEYGIEVIDSEHLDAVRLAEAVCKIMGFEYAPSQDEYFIHGKSTEKAFIYVTTNFMTTEHIRSISQKLGDRHLSILCKAFDAVPADCENITISKIPKEILDKCEWGHDDYSLNVKNLPMSEESAEPALDL